MLLEDIDRLLDDLGEAVLERPLYVIVPSRSLRLHIQSRLLAHRQRSVAGVVFKTHHGLATEIVEKAGLNKDRGPDLLGLFARRFSAQEPALARSLDHLSDGYRTVLTAVGDLLDAGLEPAHHDACEEALNAEGFAAASKAAVARAQATLRVAVRTAAAMSEFGLERSSTLLAHATQVVRETGVGPASGVLIYGYGDATGLTIDFLQALFQRYGGQLYLDRPADPARPDETDVGVVFSRNFTERLTLSIAGELPDPAPSQPATIEMFKALGGEAEVREVGRRIRRLLDDGASPERIGVVARTLDPYAEPVRTQFDRLGIPFSGVGASGFRHPAAFRSYAILDLLKLNSRTPVEQWLAARDSGTLAAAASDIRLAFHSLGAGRLEEASALSAEEIAPSGSLDLPFVEALGLEIDDAPDRPPRHVLRKRSVVLKTLVSEIERARSIATSLSPCPEPRPAAEQLAGLTALLTDELGWDEDEEMTAILLGAAGDALQALPGSFPLADDEFLNLLSDAWEKTGTLPLGGQGGGVQMLDVIEARARTFDHLFVLGLNRGRFPRSIHEDAVLPDSLRRVLARSGYSVLPDLPLKLHGFAEERFLFAQLLASSSSVTLSWQEVDDDNVLQTTSPLVERLRWSGDRVGADSWSNPPTAQARFASDLSSPEAVRLRTAYESAVIAGISGDRDESEFRGTLEQALEETKVFDCVPDSAATITVSRLKILSEVDPPPETHAGRATRSRLGPYFGFVGPVSFPEDPRALETIYVTTLKQLIDCPWQTFVGRVLGIASDDDPLEILPSIEPRILGNLTHKILERVVTSSTGPISVALAEARELEGTTVPWPDDDRLERMISTAAGEIVRSEGIALPGFDRALARFAAGYVETARKLDWPNGESCRSVVAAEFQAMLDSPDDGLLIAFRADRLDRQNSGLVLTDYKTGRPFFGDGKKPPTSKMLQAAILNGDGLQGLAYALAAGQPEDRGRYLFIKPDVDGSTRVSVEMSLEDPDVVKAFRWAVTAATATWKKGTFIPRLTKPDENSEPDRCKYCDVAEACSRGDSGARTRLRDWSEARLVADVDEAAVDSDDETVTRLWFLSSKRRVR